MLSINVLLDGQTGWPGLYVLLQGGGRVDRGPVDWDNNDYFSDFIPTVAFVQIANTDTQYVNACGGDTPAPTCTLFIGVIGEVDDASQPSLYIFSPYAFGQVLPNNVQMAGFSGSYSSAYFSYFAPTRSPFTIIVTPLDGDPDLYVNVASAWSVNSSAPWTSLSSRAEVVSVSFSEPVLNGSFTFPLEFDIAVNAAGGPSAYFIEARTDGTQPLTHALPLTAVLAGGNLTYFSFAVPPASAGVDYSWSLDVVLTSGGGGGGGPGLSPGALALSAMASNTLLPPFNNPAKPLCNGGSFGGVCDGVSFTDFSWTSASSAPGSLGVVMNVPASSSGFSTGVTYMIGVFSSTPAVAVLTATFASESQLLEDGVSVPVELSPSTFRYFTYELTREVDTEFDVTTLIGDANLYVSVTEANQRPGPAWNDGASTAFGTAPDSVTVHWAAVAASADSTCRPAAGGVTVCVIYISVGATSGLATQASIIGAATNTSVPNAVLLEDGVPSIGHTTLNTPKYYTVNLAMNGAARFPYSFTVSSIGGIRPALIVGLNGRVPTASAYDVISTSGTVTLAPWNANYCSVCTVNVGVLPFSTDVSFFVWFSTSNGTVSLVSGVEYREDVSPGFTKYYRLAYPALVGLGDVRVFGALPG